MGGSVEDAVREAVGLLGGIETFVDGYRLPEVDEVYEEAHTLLEDWEPALKMHPKLFEFMDPDREDFELVSQVRNATMPPVSCRHSC